MRDFDIDTFFCGLITGITLTVLATIFAWLAYNLGAGDTDAMIDKALKRCGVEVAQTAAEGDVE